MKYPSVYVGTYPQLSRAPRLRLCLFLNLDLNLNLYSRLFPALNRALFEKPFQKSFRKPILLSSRSP